ncbi:UNVERIFIED_CONTAM: hypothetical protein GTU68_034020 [Idotea baltica]|nr:hypothetical protein [Idotea baltica]
MQGSLNAYHQLKSTTLYQRKKWMESAAKVLDKLQGEYGQMITKEMGKPLKESMAEVEKCAWVCRYYAERAEEFLSDEIIQTDATKSMISYNSIGPVLAVMPWNFPFWQVFRFAAPALMLGNTGILKHASNVPQCALAIEEIFEAAGFPKGAFTTLLVGSDRVESLIKNPIVKGVTLTGSEPAGKAVAAIAGEQLKKTVLELGGSDPYVILHDADLDTTVPICVSARMLNTGQSCIAGKRFIVHRSIYDDFIKRFMVALKEYKFGNPLETSTTLAPMASTRLRGELHEQVQKSIKQGAEAILGGTIPSTTGAFYPPTILINVGPENIAYTDEFFGPVAIVIKADSEEEAINIANATSFGLGAAIFSKNVKKAEKIARTKLEAGCCFVNAQVKSDPRLPFGGIKNSGYGRELGKIGIHEFANVKTVYVK